jgi:hypothetical protein
VRRSGTSSQPELSKEVSPRAEELERLRVGEETTGAGLDGALLISVGLTGTTTGWGALTEGLSTLRGEELARTLLFEMPAGSIGGALIRPIGAPASADSTRMLAGASAAAAGVEWRRSLPAAKQAANRTRQAHIARSILRVSLRRGLP